MTEMQWIRNFSETLIYLLHDSRMNQTELAEAAHISQATMSKYINGIQAPGFRALLNISYVLNCDLEDLMDFGEMVE